MILNITLPGVLPGSTESLQVINHLRSHLIQLGYKNPEDEKPTDGTYEIRLFSDRDLNMFNRPLTPPALLGKLFGNVIVDDKCNMDESIYMVKNE